jgi:hypothetical protein
LPNIYALETFPMIDINLLTQKYEAKDYHTDYMGGTPMPWIVFDDFLPEDILAGVQDEINTIPQHLWSKFTRNGSFMEECNNFFYAPKSRELVLNLNSSEFLNWLENITGLRKLLADPHMIGSGYMRCYPGDSLKLHTDFNWNEQLNLNRALSIILYISRTWEPDWGGGLEFWDFDRKNRLHVIEPKPNRLLIWNYDERLVHGHPTPISCPDGHSRDGLRLFYFQSNGQPYSAPHRSLYWFNENGPYDRKENS